MLHALVYGLVAAQFVWLSRLLVLLESWWAWPVGWVATSFGVVSIASWSGMPWLLGKREDGAHSAWARLFHLPFFGVIWWSTRLFYWRGRDRVMAHEILPGLWLGRRPRAGELPSEIRHVVDLTAENAGLGAGEGWTYRAAPTMDGQAPEVEALRQLILEIEGMQGPVYVHCLAGRGRSATVVAGVLLERGAAEGVEGAIERMRSMRPQVRLSRGQRRALEAL